VRELENCVERAVALGNGRLMDISDLPPSIAAGAPPAVTSLHASAEAASPRRAGILDPDLAASPVATPQHSSGPTTDLEEMERATIQRVFEQVNGDKALAGRMLGISRATLYRKLKRYNIGVGAAAVSSSHTLQ
jgi:DNA-binding NtrC family response regulator